MKYFFYYPWGVDEDYNQGVVKIFKINENEIDIEYLQNLEFDESIEGSIGFIYQLKNGKLLLVVMMEIIFLQNLI